MRRYHITSREQAGGVTPLLDCIARSDAAGVELIQIREKDLPVRELCALVRAAVGLCRHARVLVNSRVDVALACRAAGVHLPDDSVAPAEWRRITPAGFLIGVSCHSVEDVRSTQAADLIVFAPVFEPLSKAATGPAQGLDRMREAAQVTRTPVFALGGVNEENAAACIAAGAAGVAGITLFQR
jgi:thiamine-phosphate pyrophosphorylase